MKTSGQTTSVFHSELFKHGKPISLQLGHSIFKHGDRANGFYFIVEGSVEVQFDNGTRRILKAGDFFGELGVLADLSRTASATCLSACQLVQLPSEMLELLVSEIPQVQKKVLPSYGLRLLHTKIRNKYPLNENDCAEILSKFQKLYISEGSFLIRESEASDLIYLILRGHFLVLKNNQIIARRRSGDFVGEIGLLQASPRTADVYAVSDAELLGCKASELSEILDRFPPFNLYLCDLAFRRR